ncbi:MAG: hypothetical protein HYU56_03440 [Candidatus Aenigmarchaeota archaeon]|nr:hypothetical protein [Candidatus Aenigmarchaeota archaeon]
MLSDIGIKQAMKDGSLVIEPFDEKFLGPCSYDLEIKRVYRVKRSENPFVDPKDEEEISMERFLETECEAYDGVLVPVRSYIGVSKEKVWSARYAEITTRSSAARLGIQTFPLNKIEIANTAEPDHVYFSISTFGTTCEVPTGRRLSQLFVHSGFPLPRKTLHLGGKIKRYNDGILHPDQNNEACFSQVTVASGCSYYLKPREFYLAHTEWLKCPDNAAGMLVKLPEHRLMGQIHLYAPLISPGSEGHQVLEIYLAEGLRMKEGQPVCEVEFWPLDQNPQNAYNGKYQGQKGPQTSLFHTEGA